MLDTKDHQHTKIGKPFKGKRNEQPLTILNINTIFKVGILKMNVHQVHVRVLHFFPHPGGDTRTSCRGSHLCACHTFSSKTKRSSAFLLLYRVSTTLPCGLACGCVTCWPCGPPPPPPPGCWSSPWPRPRPCRCRGPSETSPPQTAGGCTQSCRPPLRPAQRLGGHRTEGSHPPCTSSPSCSVLPSAGRRSPPSLRHSELERREK